MRRCLQFHQFCALLWTHSWRNKNCALRPALQERREQDNHRCLLNVKRIYGENFLGGFWWTWSKTSLFSNVNFCWDDKWITSNHKSVQQESRTRDECRVFWFKFKKSECPFEGFVAQEAYGKIKLILSRILCGLYLLGLDLTASAGVSCEKSEHTAVTETSEV